ncbi:hypothetical protein WA026_021811 [Henosepilachna vigintioctopunctata]|uniref:Gamma-interferon-inducible lysosomal thiol reductase n=1 Tax=Henosepilachna vigintioctopunctata TaxID=420089 RepID=A0AAW1TR88_9CUCU
MVSSSVILIISIYCFLGLVTSDENNANLTKVSIYYETLCSDSIIFIRNDFYPNYERLKHRILVDFVPYGKSRQSRASNGSWTFTCHHGSWECRGNKYQACALDQTEKQDQTVEFVKCVMWQTNPTDADDVKECALSNGLDWNKISSCQQGNRGDELLANYGNRTLNLNPKLVSVPTILFDDVYDENLQKLCQRDFLRAACSKISEPKPDACKIYPPSLLQNAQKS